MYGEDTVEARQRNELEALQAIYGNDLKDLRKKGAWSTWTPLNLSVSLRPQKGSSGAHEIYATIDLHVICDDKYPENVPKIQLENSKGLSQATVVELLGQLEEKAKEFKGEEMIFQLAQYVEEFLHKHNKPTSKSFYDEMLKRQKEQKEKDLQAMQMEQDLERQYILEEVQQRQEVLKSEIRRKREYRQFSENDEDYEVRNQSNSGDNSDEPRCEHKGTLLLEFNNRAIQRGSCIEHSSEDLISFSGIDTESGDLVVIDEWSISVGNKDLSSVHRQITSIEQELNYLTRLRHRNLSGYYSIKYHFDEDILRVYILKEFIYGSTCSSLFLKQNTKVDLDLLKYIAKGSLLALDYLHRNNVIHRDIKHSCIHLSESGHIKISNYSIHKRLYDLQSRTHNNYNKKTDIFKLGVLLLSLLQGNSVSDETLDIPTSLQPDLYDFLSRCLCKEESARSTAAQLLNHQLFQKTAMPISSKQLEEEIAIENNNSPEVILNELQTLSQMSNGQSRINNEFEFLQHLGKGAYGDVIKVRNKLDGGYYAIKRIQLNPKNKILNKKIVREVKLLSRLNHENVVRYYNSWIETTTIKEETCTSSETSGMERVPVIARKDEFTLSDNIEDLAPAMKNVEVSITYDSKSQVAFDSSSEDDSSDEEEEWGVVVHEDSDYDGVEFEHNSGGQSLSSSSVVTSNADPVEPAQGVKQIDFMYIQMEFCEKSTLRTAIDDNLYLNEDRLWRLFREIVEGLAHIHQQGMIHRDLKPVNIFLDSEDHVKIGDFGLATTNIKSKQYELSKSALESEKEDVYDESKTGLIGTALYAAPELSTSCKVVYNQKVDIYSLGIILFEMCYKPLSTSMERIKILTKLRLPEITFPDDFVNRKNQRQVFLIRWLLDHDISKRPTSQELLSSEHIPPPVLEERELQELVRHTLSNPQLKGYKYLIASCFDQQVTPAQDITYDKDPSALNVGRPLQVFDYVRGVCEKIFKQHGGQNLATPLLMPKSKFYDHLESCVKLMTHAGEIVTLPHDLRVPFARYVAWNSIHLLRRYSIERVYREKKIFGFQPRELYECAFDIVSPSAGNLILDAELLYIVYEIIHELPVIRSKHFIIRLNHTSLIKAILMHFGIKTKYLEIFNLISDVKEGKSSKHNMQNYFTTFGLPDNTIHLLVNLLNSEFEITKCISHFQMITKKKQSEASQLAKQALQDLKAICQNAVMYGVTFEMVVSPGLVYNYQQYSGVIFQFACELKKKHRHSNMEVIAAGGRYDTMISHYRLLMEQANMLTKGVQQSAVGISLSLDKLVQAIQKEQREDLTKMESVDVVVCSVGHKQMIKEKTKILRSLWAAGIRSYLLESSSAEDIQEQLMEIKVPHVIILKENEHGTVRVRSWERDRFHEKSFSTTELVDNMHKIIRNWNDVPLENCNPVMMKSDSKANCNETRDQETDVYVDVLFITAEKLSWNSRKRTENQIRSQLDGLFKRFTGFVVVVGLSVDSTIVKSLASSLEFESEYHFQKSVESVIEKHPRQKKYLEDICDEIYKQKVNRTDPTLILYSLVDYCYKVVL